MTTEEQSIVDYLKSSPDAYFARKEIARRAVRREEYEANNHWLNAPLASLLALGVIEKNDSGHYRLKIERRQ